MTITSVIKTYKSWLTICQQQKKNKKYLANIQIIIKDNIPHTPSKVGVLVRMIISHTPEEAMSVGLAKACVLRKKICSVQEKLSYLLKYKKCSIWMRIRQYYKNPLMDTGQDEQTIKPSRDQRQFQLVEGKNDSTAFLPLGPKLGGNSKKKEVNKNDSINKNCLTSRQEDYIYKKVELGSLINKTQWRKR